MLQLGAADASAWLPVRWSRKKFRPGYGPAIVHQCWMPEFILNLQLAHESIQTPFRGCRNQGLHSSIIGVLLYIIVARLAGYTNI